jgi:hypothetical protein
MSDIVGYFLNYGVLGIMCFLLILGMLIPKPTVDDIKDDRNEWRQAYMTEAAAHAATREALKDATERADAAVETAKVANALLSSLGHKDGT